MTKELATVEMVDIFADFAVNDDAVWVAYKGDVEFLIARNGNKDYRKMMAHQYKKNARLIDSGTEAADAKSNEIMIEVMAKSILVGWKGSVALKGKTLDYSIENAKQLLSVPMFREWIFAQATDTQAYKAVQQDEYAKN